MNRTSRSPSRRSRTLGIILAVACAGFAVAAFGVILVFFSTGYSLPWTAIGVYVIVSLLTITIIGIVGWGLLADAPTDAETTGDAVESAFERQRQLLDDVRHELKTPITIVRSHLELMDPKDAEDVATTRDIGIAELDRMTRLIGDIDLLAAVEGDQFTMGEVDLAALTQRMSELVMVIPGHTWSVDQVAAMTVPGNDDRLLQAWLQLAENAAKYTPEDTPIQIGSAVSPRGAQFWVRDHGPGIPPANRHRIFRRFARADGKRSVGGSGLGLAIVDAIAKAHHGQCTVADTAGGGATFTIEIPIGSNATLPAPVRAGDVVMQREASG